jgi:hypothetical protein
MRSLLSSQLRARGWSANRFLWLFPEPPVWLISVVMTVIIVGLVVVAMFIFRGESPGRISEEAILAQRASVEQAGLLLPEPYLAKRAFQVEEFEDEGSHYYIELDDGGVLFLSGQYLYEYEPVFRRDRLERPRSFPCTRFSLRRHQEDGHLVDIRCEGPAWSLKFLRPLIRWMISRMKDIPKIKPLFGTNPTMNSKPSA